MSDRALRAARAAAHADSSNWRCYGLIYHARGDNRVFVPKRQPWLGWTINMARPLSIPVVTALVGVPLLGAWLWPSGPRKI